MRKLSVIISVSHQQELLDVHRGEHRAVEEHVSVGKSDNASRAVLRSCRCTPEQHKVEELR